MSRALAQLTLLQSRSPRRPELDCEELFIPFYVEDKARTKQKYQKASKIIRNRMKTVNKKETLPSLVLAVSCSVTTRLLIEVTVIECFAQERNGNFLFYIERVSVPSSRGFFPPVIKLFGELWTRSVFVKECHFCGFFMCAFFFTFFLLYQSRELISSDDLGDTGDGGGGDSAILVTVCNGAFT